MIEVTNLTKRYGSHVAVDNATFTIHDGEILGFLGPNGAGKSTTMNIITGYLSATSGSVKIDGYDILTAPLEAKKRIGFLPELPPLYLDMTVKEYLNFVYDLKKVKLPRRPHINEICRLVKIQEVYPRQIKNLSKGYRQRVGIAQALVGNPDVLILDEPTVGLDPKQIIEIRNLIKLLGKTHTVILSSHILSEVQAVCERVIIINQGRIVVDNTPENLSRIMSDDHSIIARIEGPRREIMAALKSLKGVKSVQAAGAGGYGQEYIINPIVGYDIRRALFSLLAEKNWPLLMLKSREMTLEDICLRLTDGTADTAALEKALQARGDKPQEAGGQPAEEEETADFAKGEAAEAEQSQAEEEAK